MVYEEHKIVPRRSAKFQIFPINNSPLSASLVLNFINFLFQNFWFLIFLEKKRIAEKSWLDQFCVFLEDRRSDEIGAPIEKCKFKKKVYE